MSKKRLKKLDAETTVYGFAIHKSGSAYCFNKQYHVFNWRPSPEEVSNIKRRATNVQHGRAHGHGRFRPVVEDEKEWTTYFVPGLDTAQWFNTDYRAWWYEEGRPPAQF